MDTNTLLTDTPYNLLRKYRQVLEDHDIPVDKLILFGSFAKNTQDISSDLDVCVVSPVLGKKPFEEMVRLAKLAAEVDSMIEPHPYSPMDLANPWDPLATEIRNYGVEIT